MSETVIPPSRPIVVKLGGSLAESGRLKDVLAIVANARVPLVVVPGGGRFADTVRAEQKRVGFSDEAAHRMALLAMHQTGVMLGELARSQNGGGSGSRLKTVSSVEEIRSIAAVGQIPVWLPVALAEDATGPPRDWSLTSDGLAAWLATLISSPRVALVKSRAVDPRASARELAVEGVIDPVFADLVERHGLPWSVFGPGDDARLAAMLTASAAAQAR